MKKWISFCFMSYFFLNDSSTVQAEFTTLDPSSSPAMFLHRFLQQAFFSFCASSAAALGWDNVTALIEPRVTSLLLTFLWISERRRSNNDSVIMIMKCLHDFKPD